VKHLIGLVEKLKKNGLGLISLLKKIVTTNANGKLIFPIFHSLAEFERGVIREWNNIGLTSANARRATRTAEKKSFVFRKINLIVSSMFKSSISILVEYSCSSTTQGSVSQVQVCLASLGKKDLTVYVN